MTVDTLLSGLSGAGFGAALSAITVGGILRVIVMLLVGIIVIRVLMNMVDRMLERSPSLHSLRVYIRSAMRLLLWFLLILVVLGSLGVEVTSIIALLGVAGLAVSLALQNTLSNVAGGIMVLAAKPFEVGDYIETEGVQGTVTAVDLAYTSLSTVDNKEIHVPNSQISAAKIINYNHLERRRVDLTFCASYEAPTQMVKAAIAQAMEKFPQILQDPAPEIHLSQYGDSSIAYVVRMWTSTDDYWTVHYGMLEEVRESFARNGVKMTYGHLNVHMVNE